METEKRKQQLSALAGSRPSCSTADKDLRGFDLRIYEVNGASFPRFPVSR